MMQPCYYFIFMPNESFIPWCSVVAVSFASLVLLIPGIRITSVTNERMAPAQAFSQSAISVRGLMDNKCQGFNRIHVPG